MKKILLFGVFSAAVLAVCSCGAGQKDAEGFPPVETLAADSVGIAEVLSPESWEVYNGYAVIVSLKNDKVLFRYRLPGWEFADTSFAKGGGPDDLQYAGLVGTASSGQPGFWVSDFAAQKMVKCRMTPQGISKEGQSRFARRGVVTNRDVVFGDTLVVSVTRESEDQAHLRTSAIGDSLRRVDSTVCYSVSKMDIQNGADGKIKSIRVQVFNSPEIKASGDRMAVWYPGTGNLVAYRIGPGGKFVQEGVYGKNPLTLEAAKALADGGKDPERKAELLRATSEHLYFLEYEREKAGDLPEGQQPKTKSATVKVYDWAMNPVKKFALDHPAGVKVLVDEANARFYAYDPSLDFEQVYVYGYKL